MNESKFIINELERQLDNTSNQNTREISNVEFYRTIEKYNQNHALTIDFSKNELGYIYLKIGSEVIEKPMSTIEAYNFVLGVQYIRELTA